MRRKMAVALLGLATAGLAGCATVGQAARPIGPPITDNASGSAPAPAAETAAAGPSSPAPGTRQALRTTFQTVVYEVRQAIEKTAPAVEQVARSGTQYPGQFAEALGTLNAAVQTGRSLAAGNYRSDGTAFLGATERLKADYSQDPVAGDLIGADVASFDESAVTYGADLGIYNTSGDEP